MQNEDSRVKHSSACVISRRRRRHGRRRGAHRYSDCEMPSGPALSARAYRVTWKALRRDWSSAPISHGAVREGAPSQGARLSPGGRVLCRRLPLYTSLELATLAESRRISPDLATSFAEQPVPPDGREVEGDGPRLLSGHISGELSGPLERQMEMAGPAMAGGMSASLVAP